MNAKTFLAERFLKHRTLCWSILDIKLSFLPCFMRFLQNLDINLSILRWFVAFFVNFGHENVVFALVRGIFAELRTVVRPVCGQFCGRSFALGVSFVSVCSNSECERNGCQRSVHRCSPRVNCWWTFTILVFFSLVCTETAHMWSFRESYSVGLPGLVGYLDCIE